jgi:adenylate cyclase
MRIRAAEAWVSPRGLVNDEIDISRGFGFYNAVPAVNALPDIITRTLTEADEFIIIGNRGLWDYCSYQTAVDIARTEKDDPMMAAQKLRDFALSYGAEGSTMIMVISVRDLFYPRASRSRQQMAADKESGVADLEGHFNVAKRINRRKGEEVVGDRTLQRLQQEVEPPTGQVALVFTDIKNSTSLWETNAGMQTAMRLHNSLLRRQLRIIGGYEVKTEGDSFMVSFPTVTSAMLWCFTCQLQLINEDWPREILECDDGREVLDASGDRIHRGLSVRMGIHWGTPVWEKDPITRRMDYFGPMVNKSARINASADGGQIMASSDVLKEVQGLYDYLETEEDDQVEQLPGDVGRDITQLRRLGLGVLDMGERKLKGLEGE